MIPLFFMLCVSFSGGEDCDYTWTLINDFEEWSYLHDYYNVSGTPQTTGGFTLFPQNEIFLWKNTDELEHEKEHVQCNKKSTNLMERYACNQKIDTRDIILQSTRNSYQSTESPKISGKLLDSTYGRTHTVTE